MHESPDAPGPGLSQFRSYLQLLAQMQHAPWLKGKLDASDVVQQTLLQAYRSMDQFRGTTSEELAGWLRQILARNVAHATRDFSRAKRDVARERSLERSIADSSQSLERWLAAEQSSPSQKLQRHEHLQLLADALESLSDDQRSAIILHYWQGRSLADIGEQLERTPAAVAGLVHRGLKKLRTRLNSLE